MLVLNQQCKVTELHTPMTTHTHTYPPQHTHTHLATHTYMYIYLNPADSLVFMARPLDEHILHARTLTVHMLGMMGVHRHCPGLVCLCDSQRQKQKLQTGSQNCTHEQKVHTAILGLLHTHTHTLSLSLSMLFAILLGSGGMSSSSDFLGLVFRFANLLGSQATLMIG